MSKKQSPTAAAGGTAAGWKCPTCGRRFARAKQSHSCKPQSLDSHFAGREPDLRRLFELLLLRLQKTGPLRVDAVKTSINLISRHHFGGVAVRKGYLRIGFFARAPLQSARIVHREVVGPNRVAHFIVVRTRADVDAELLGWLADAQQLRS